MSSSLPRPSSKPKSTRALPLGECFDFLKLAAADAHRSGSVIIPTIIGEGSKNQGLHPVHGAALGVEDVAAVKKLYGMDPDKTFHMSDEVYEQFAHIPERGAKQEKEWNDLYAKYAKEFPAEYEELERRMKGQLPQGWQQKLPAKSELPKEAKPTRQASGYAIRAWAPEFKEFMVGSADLMAGTFVNWDGMVEFHNPKTGHGDWSGRQIRYGIREHCSASCDSDLIVKRSGVLTRLNLAVAAIANALAAYFPVNKESGGAGIVPVMATYYIFFSCESLETFCLHIG